MLAYATRDDPATFLSPAPFLAPTAVTRKPRPARPARAEAEPLRRPAPWALALLGAWAALLLLAPPESNWFWGVNGFRSLPIAGRLGLLAAAALAGGFAAVRLRSAAWWWTFAFVLAVTLAFPLHESVHFLGDTAIRIRAMFGFSVEAVQVPLVEWTKRIHANPLDFAVNFLLPILFHRTGDSIRYGVSIASLLVGLAFFAGVWRASGRLGAPRESRVALCAALVMAGTLEAFAGYAESAGLLLAAAAWWWAEMLAPLDGRPRAARAAIAWFAFFLAHRIALVMLLPQLWRAVGPALPGDKPEARRLLLGMTAAGVAGAGVFLATGVGAGQLGLDLREMFSVARGRGELGPLPPSDVANALTLVAPLAFLMPVLAGRAAILEWWRRPESRLMVVAVLPLLPLAWLLPSGASALGAHRDWDLNALLGWTLTLLAGAVMARLPAGRLRGALVAVMPVLALHAGSWVAVNAHEGASIKRALALPSKPPLPAAAHQSAALVYLGQRALDREHPELAGPYYERAFDLNPNPRQALLAVEAYLLNRDLASARRMMAAARTRELSPSLQVAAGRLEAMMARAAGDTSRAPVAPFAIPPGRIP